jgi:DNA adenine methylase
MDTDKVKSVKATIIKEMQNEEKRVVYGVVLKPNVPDFQGDVMNEDDVMWSAHNFLMFYRQAGIEHEQEASAVLVESFLCPMDMNFEDREVPKGSWIVGMKILSDDLWLKIKTGYYAAFSAGGYGVREDL